MYLFFDTETTGVPDDYDAPVSDIENWPRVVQIAWAGYDRRAQKRNAKSYVIRPDGYRIPRDAERVHGISTSRAQRIGVSIADVLDELADAIEKASVMVAHNIDFDSKVVGAEFYRLGIRRPFRGKGQICTMKESTDYCALPGRYGNKRPKLAELHLKLFNKKLKDAHDALSDVTTCAKCFFELKRLGVIRTPS